jgi:hypothetical protein
MISCAVIFLFSFSKEKKNYPNPGRVRERKKESREEEYVESLVRTSSSLIPEI